MGLRHYLMATADGFGWKSALSIAGTLIAYIEGFYGELIWVFLAVFVGDLITGIWKSAHKGEPISSKRMRESVTKLGGYMVLLSALIVTSKYEQSLVPIITATYYYFIFTELKSILENVGELGVPIPGFLSDKINSKANEGSYKQVVTTEVKQETTTEVTMPVNKDEEEVQEDKKA